MGLLELAHRFAASGRVAPLGAVLEGSN